MRNILYQQKSLADLRLDIGSNKEASSSNLSSSTEELLIPETLVTYDSIDSRVLIDQGIQASNIGIGTPLDIDGSLNIKG